VVSLNLAHPVCDLYVYCDEVWDVSADHLSVIGQWCHMSSGHLLMGRGESSWYFGRQPSLLILTSETPIDLYANIDEVYIANYLHDLNVNKNIIISTVQFFGESKNCKINVKLNFLSKMY